MDIFQFYPTPDDLARKAWRMFKDRSFARILDPSAGDGALLKACPYYRGSGTVRIDAVEIDPQHHSSLRDAGATIVGMDFDQFEALAAYSTIIMNPPFARGAEHVLRAWDGLFDGEIVAIINAETLRNPFSAARQRLVQLIEEAGRVEFHQDEFLGPDVRRETAVEVALVHLIKKVDPSSLIEDLSQGLRQDSTRFEDGEDSERQLMLPNNFVENAVISFNAAVRAANAAVHAQAQARYYAGLLGDTMVRRSGGCDPLAAGQLTDTIRTEMATWYDNLKDRAWAHVLHSTQVDGKLSTLARKRLLAQFDEIKKLEFSVPNVYGFLEGLSNSGLEIQREMALDIFDQITRYHSENAVHYMGWKSNDRHRSCGMKIKMNRFILPHHEGGWNPYCLPTKAMHLLADLDNVFAMLDGKVEPEIPLKRVANTEFNNLKDGGRVSGSYFDMRWYRGIGTLHFFPKRKDLVDRLNRMVGQARAWLPPVTEEGHAPKAFWGQYEQAEKFDDQLRKVFAKNTRGRTCTRISDAFLEDRHDNQFAQNALVKSMEEVLADNGIELDQLLPVSQPRPLTIEVSSQLEEIA